MWQVLVRRKSTGFVVIAILIIAILPMLIPSHWTHTLTQLLIMALIATALNIEIGYAGMMAIGHAMFIGIGAYSFGILIIKFGLPLYMAIVVALVVSVIINVAIGYLCLRGTPLTFGLLHLACNILLSTLVAKWIALTGGDAGLTGVKRPGIISGELAYYFLVLAVVLICYALIRMIISSPFGRIAQGLRENEERLLFLGINTKRYQLILFVIAGFFTAVAGILLTMLNRGVYPEYMSLIVSAQVMMMCLIGGMYNFLGPSVGAALVVIFSTLTSDYTSYWRGILGIVMMATVLGFRGGILRKGKNKLKPLLEKQVGFLSSRKKQ